MTLNLILALIAMGVAGTAWYVWHWWTTAKRTVHYVARWYPTLVEVSEFIALGERASKRSHFFERHSPVLRREEIHERALSGSIPFSGVKGRAATSTRWYLHEDMLAAINLSLKNWKADIRPSGGAFVFEYDHPVGEGYLKGEHDLRQTHFAKVIVREGEIVTAYPDLAGPTSGAPNVIRVSPSDYVRFQPH